jgi:hypothetical protein
MYGGLAADVSPPEAVVVANTVLCPLVLVFGVLVARLPPSPVNDADDALVLKPESPSGPEVLPTLPLRACV